MTEPGESPSSVAEQPSAPSSSAASPAASPKAPPPRRRFRLLVRLAQVFAGLVLGLVLAEGLFYWRDQGAFPHLNLYVPDPELGMRLRPNATERVSFGGAGVTTVRTNSLGYRGGEWPAAAAPVGSAVAPAGSAAPATGASASTGEILVIGDSQAFGLGVEENETFEARLASVLGRTVLNAGVPTWGPPEYNRALAELLEKRHPRLVIWVVNAYNDFFEADRPNRERHAVLDGWAVRRELAPVATPFLGRGWLFSESHAVYALRRWLYARLPDPSALGAPSEGTWRDLVGVSAPVAQTRSTNLAVEKEYLHVRDDELRNAEQALAAAQANVERIATDLLPSAITFPGDGVSLSTIRSTPGDIVDYGDGGEFARPGPVTVGHIRVAVRARNHAIALLRERAAKQAGSGEAKEIESALARETAFGARVLAVRDQPVTLVRALSPLSRRVEEAKALCDRAGAELLVLALPMDVQVSPEEWKKYGVPSVDLEPTRVLITDVVESAEAIGARGLDATDALRKAGSGAFLPRDLHLSVKGHAAVADAVAASLVEYRPRLPHGGLPPGRSRAPTTAEWKSVGETLVYGSSARACVTKRIREWLSLWCTEGDGYSSMPQAAQSLRLREGGRGEALIARWKGPWLEYDYYPYTARVVEGKERTQLVLVAPVLPGDQLVVDFFWPGKKSTLVVRLPKELEAQTVEFQKFSDEPSEPLAITPAATELCDCHRKLTGAADCLGLAAMPDADCQRTWGHDCANLLACSAGQPEAAPKCAAGFANGGGLDHCFPLCGRGRSCAAGAVCVDWQGGDLCMPAPLAEPSAGVSLVVVPVESSPKTLELGRAAMQAGAATVRGCKLINEDQPSVYYDVYDACPLEAAVTTAAVTAARTFAEYVTAHPAEADGRARVLARRTALFADWIELAQERRFTRGTLPSFSGVCDVWNEWRPKERQDPYGEDLLRQFHRGLRTKGRTGPPVWVTCKTGPCL